MLNLYAIFHLNLCFSSIEEEQRAEVVRRCYRPLLALARELDLPFGFEATGYTLERIAELDPGWIAELKGLLSGGGRCELVGSGYAQLIGPLVPARVNRENLRLGNRVYGELLGVRPRVALVNEQAYSAGLLPHFREAGYEAVVMEWDNPSSTHPEWDPEWRYLPQVAAGPGADLPVIWNNSIFFQKFQRYAHGEVELDEYLGYLRRHDDGSVRAIPLYGNDVEIFDFRPGRFRTEAAVGGDEWGRIRALFEALLADPAFRFVSPSELLSIRASRGDGVRLRLESPESPVPVKKQEKYNITRWAVTGRDDLSINGACHRLHGALSRDPAAGDDDWRELCYLWSSDFRTHITAKRWVRYRRRLSAFLRRKGGVLPPPRPSAWIDSLPPGLSVLRSGNFLDVDAGKVKVRVNLRRGLALDSVVFPAVDPRALCGTLHHGYYDDITTGADFYTGHFVFETVGRPKVTDLDPVEPVVRWLPGEGALSLSGAVATALGRVEKVVLVSPGKGTVTVEYAFHWPLLPVGCLRLGNVTLIPDSFPAEELFFRTHLGGTEMEDFPVAGKRIHHGESSSFLVSAKQGLGITGGVAEVGDRSKVLRVEFDPGESPLLGLVSFRTIRDRYFFRLALSASEMDETSRQKRRSGPLRCSVTLSARKA